jgi:hypothetical protein
MNALAIPDIACAAGITVKHCKRIMSEIKRGKRQIWRGASPAIIAYDPIVIDTQTLPLEIREAVLMFDQIALPFTPPPSPN